MTNWKRFLSFFLAVVFVITGFHVEAGIVAASTATNVTVTGVSQPIDHFEMGVRFDVTLSTSVADPENGDSVQGLENLVQLTGTGDEFSHEGMDYYAVDNTLWVILYGPTLDDMQTVQEGAVLTIDAGEITVGDVTYSITNSITLTYIDGTWVQDAEEEIEANKISIIGVSGLEEHDEDVVRLRLYTSELIGEANNGEGSYISGLQSRVTLGEMGDSFNPTGSDGYVTYGESQILFIFYGVSITDMPTVPDGAQITFTPGEVTIGDHTYNITNDVTWTYEDGSWIEKKDLPEISFTGVSGLEDHGEAVRLHLDASEKIEEGKDGYAVLDLSDIVTLSGMGDSFAPTDSYGFVTYGESQILWIFEGITITDMPTVPDRAQITFTPGEVTIGDTTYYVTNDSSLTYDASADKWLVTEGSVTVSGVAKGTSDTTAAEEGYKQVAFDGVGVATGKNTNGDGGWLLYLTSTDELPGTADDAIFTGIQISVNDGERFPADIQYVSYYTEKLAFIWLQEDKVPQQIDEEYTITIHAGKGEPGSSEYEGIQLIEDYILTLDTSETWQLEEVDTSVWDVKLDCDDILNYASDTFSWPCVFDGQETNIQMTYDGDTIAFSFPILEEAIASNQYVAITLKAGSMTGVDGSTLELCEDVNLHFNQYGLSVKKPIILDTADVSFALSSTSSATLLSFEALKEDAIAEGSTLTPARGVVDGVYYRGDNGIFTQGQDVSHETAVLSKADTYTIQLQGFEISEGTELLLQGLYTSGDKLVEYTPTILIWNGSTWSIQLQPTHVRGDANGDGVADIRDVVRANRYLNDNADSNLVSIYANGANMIADSSEVNAIDLKEMKLTLLGEQQIEMAAYSGPGYRHSYTDAENWISESDFQDYVDCGFTYLFPETDAAYNRIYNYETGERDDVHSSFAKSDLYQFMTLAEKMNIPVVPFDYKISEDIKTNMITQLLVDDKKYLSQMVKDLSQFDMFKGLTLQDEPAIGGQTAVRVIKNYLDKLMPNMFTFTSHHPLYADITYLTTDTTKSQVAAYEEYIDAFSTAYGTFAYDNYPLISEKQWLWTTNKIEESWFQNLALVAESAKIKGYDAGITIQSVAYNSSTGNRRKLTSKADVGFQMYTALAYGMKSVNYYTYWSEDDSAMVCYTDGRIEKTAVYNYVKAVNWEVRQFDHVLLDYAWKGTMAVTPANYTASDAFQKISSTDTGELEATAIGGEALIGCMEDARGRDGYMLVNATEPSSDQTVTLTVKFKDATKATAYIEGVEKEIPLTDGSYPFKLNPGQGVFVVLDK